MQNVMFRLSDTPGGIRWAGRGLGDDNQAVYGDQLGLTEKELTELANQGVLWRHHLDRHGRPSPVRG